MNAMQWSHWKKPDHLCFLIFLPLLILGGILSAIMEDFPSTTVFGVGIILWSVILTLDLTEKP